MSTDPKEDAKVEMMKQLMGTLGTMKDSRTGDIMCRELSEELVKLCSGPREGANIICEAATMAVLETLFEDPHTEVEVTGYMACIEIIQDAMLMLLTAYQLGGTITVVTALPEKKETVVEDYTPPFLER
jgi:hypothetical protein